MQNVLSYDDIRENLLCSKVFRKFYKKESLENISNKIIKYIDKFKWKLKLFIYSKYSYS